MKTTPDDWRRAGTLFERALEVPSGERSAWLRRECGGDDELRLEVEALLAAHERTDGLLDLPREPAARGRVGPYKIVAELGRGGMGVVYKARDARLGRFVALKFLPRGLGSDPQARARFLAEARSASALDHPNICTIHDIGSEEDDLYIVMACYEGRTLDTALRNEDLPSEQKIDVAAQVADGLRAAHAAGIVHRDIKPRNLLLTDGGLVKILDFGVAKLAGGATSTCPGTLIGTPSYMSPEQATGGAVDGRTDIWSLGVVLYEMLAGKRPFEGDQPSAVIRAIIEEEPAALRSVDARIPPALESIVERALAKNPDDRYSGAEELLAELRRLSVVRPSADVLGAPQRGTLPVSLTSLVGREDEREQLRRLLSEARLITLMGPGGTGKTRLAVEVAADHEAVFRDGVTYVSLGAITDPTLVPSSVAQALGVAEKPSRPLSEALVEHLAARQVLLVLDNFEQVVAAAPFVAELLSRSRELRVLVTSRVALRVAGEQLFPVAPLELAPPGVAPDPDTLRGFSSVRLFVERAQAVRPGFRLDRDTASAVAELCRRLDGLPLAIELAAARTNLLSPAAMLSRIGKRLDLLKGRARDRPARHQTLRQAIAWSYDLLEEDERALYLRLGVFAGGFTLRSAEALAAQATPRPRRAGAVEDALSSLIDQSLVLHQEGDGEEPRFGMLEVIREHAVECMADSGELDTVREAHARHFLALAERAAGELTGRHQRYWLERLAAEHDNLRAALSWAEESSIAEMALRLGAAMWRFWLYHGHLLEGRSRFERIWRNLGHRGDATLRGRVLHALATLAHNYGENRQARAYLEEALRIRKSLGDEHGVVEILNNLSWTACELSDLDTAQRLGEEALRCSRKLGATRAMALAFNNLGWVAAYRGDFRRAREAHLSSLELRREVGDDRGAAFALTNIAWCDRECGSLTGSEGQLSEAARVLERMRDRVLFSWVLIQRAGLEAARGDLHAADATLRESLEVGQEAGNRSTVAWTITLLGRVRGQVGDREDATQSLEEGLSMWKEIESSWGIAYATLFLGEVHLSAGDEREALRCFRESLALSRSMGGHLGVVRACEAIAAHLSLAARDPSRAAVLLAAAARWRRDHGLPLTPFVPAGMDLPSRLRQALGDARLAELEEKGQAKSLDAVADLAQCP